MTAVDTAPILENGAVLTKAGVIVDLELEGDRGLFFCTKEGGVLDTDRAEFDSRQERDEALLPGRSGCTSAGDGRWRGRRADAESA